MTSFLLVTLFNCTLTQRLLLKPWNLLATSVLLNFSSSSFLQILETVPHSFILSYLLCCAVLNRWVVSDSLRPHATPMAPLSIGILQAGILECAALPSSRGPSQPRDQSQVSHTASGFFTVWATREALVTYCFVFIVLLSHTHLISPTTL